MKMIKFESNYGNFAYRMTAEIGEDVNEETAWLAESQGLANIAYRVAGSSVDKALGVKERKAVGFSDADAEKINAAVSKKITEMEAHEKTGKFVKALKLSFAVTGQHEFGEGAEKGTKEATEVWTRLQQEKDATKFAATLAKLGLGDDYTDETAIIAVAKALRDARKVAAEAAKAGLLGV